jgi:predicted SprT family Zn-dependent metalloprotease
MVWLGNNTPCQNNCGFMFQETRKYDLMVNGELKFLCKACYEKLKVERNGYK